MLNQIFRRFFYEADGMESGNTETVVTEKTTITPDNTSENTTVETITDDDSIEAIEAKLDKSREARKQKPVEEEKTVSDNTENNESDTTDTNEGKTKTGGKYTKITDEYINSLPESERPFIQGMKGESMSEKAIKSYVSAQKLIHDLKTNATTDAKQELVPDDSINNFNLAAGENELSKIALDKEAESKIMSNAVKRLTAKFKDAEHPFPQSDDEWFDLPPLIRAQYEREYFAAREAVEADYRQVVLISTKYKSLNYKAANDALTKIKGKLDNWGIKPEQLGLNLSLKDNRNDLITMAIIDPKTKSFNPQTVEVIGRNKQGELIHVYDPDAIASKIFEHIEPQIVELVKSDSYRKGFERRAEKEPEPSMSNGAITGSGAKREVPKENRRLTGDETPEEMDAVLDAQRRALRKK